MGVVFASSVEGGFPCELGGATSPHLYFTRTLHPLRGAVILNVARFTVAAQSVSAPHGRSYYL
jgi:hypothetical protein